MTGTLRSKRLNNPTEILEKKLRKRELVVKYANGVNVLKWMDKRNTLMLSTEHEGKLIDTQNRRGQHQVKPQCIVEYNT